MAFVALDAFAQGVEVEAFEGASGVEAEPIMGDEELALAEVDIGFDAGEAMVEGVLEGAFVVVVVVGVGFL